jgi:hypothetical protein
LRSHPNAAGATLPASRFFLDQQRNEIMPFAKGQSGNPAGRPPGAHNKSMILLQSLLEGDAEKIAK